MKNRTAIITRGSRGLDRNTAVNLLRRGVHIFFTGRANECEVESLMRTGSAFGRPGTASGIRYWLKEIAIEKSIEDQHIPSCSRNHREA